MTSITDSLFEQLTIFLAYLHSTSLLILASYAVIIIVLYYAFRMIFTLVVNKFLTFREVTLTRPYPDSKKILIVGDSSAVGTGARKKEETISGRFARDFPHSDILNLATNGSLTRDVLKQFKQAGNTVFDLIIISTGGNDIWHYTKLKSLSRDLIEVLRLANAMSNHKVILLWFGNEGSAPFFPFFIRWFIMRRTEQVKKVFTEVVHSEGVPLVELFSSFEGNPFIKDPKRFFARDKLHPSSEGYRLWYERMWRIMVQNGYLYDEHLAVHSSQFSGDIHE